MKVAMTEKTSPAVPAHWPSEAALIADLKATYPGIQARPIAEFGYKPCQHGVWTGGEATMPDGEPIFSSLSINDPDSYDGQVHHAFVEWLDQRAWFVESFDGQVFFIRSKAEEADALLAELAFSELLDQEREAKIVLYRLQAQIGDQKAEQYEKRGWDTDAQIERDKAVQHRLVVATLRCLRTGAQPVQAGTDPF